MTDKIRYGVLSSAQIARNQHLPAAREAANAEIVAISSPTLEQAQKWATELQIPRAYGSCPELIADPNIDAIIKPLSNSMHCAWRIAAAEAGKHHPLRKTAGRHRRPGATHDRRRPRQ